MKSRMPDYMQSPIPTASKARSDHKSEISCK